tara:strand:+ start:367 stop:510 length:144 start_codon:yes stop_codon:yes gene_type:complete
LKQVLSPTDCLGKNAEALPLGQVKGSKKVGLEKSFPWVFLSNLAHKK